MPGHLEDEQRATKAIQCLTDARIAVKLQIDALWELRKTIRDSQTIDRIDRALLNPPPEKEG